MIRSFKSKGLEKFYATGTKKGIQPKHANKLELILAALDAAKAAEDLDLPGFSFHRLHPPGACAYAVSVSGNYRVSFRFNPDGAPEDVDYLDYH